jgi:hypothetical protein
MHHECPLYPDLVAFTSGTLVQLYSGGLAISDKLTKSLKPETGLSGAHSSHP